MKTPRFASLLFIVLAAFGLKGQSQIPKVDQVIISFFQKYNFTKPDPVRITFEKKRDGWYTAEEDVNVPPYRHTNVQLFWSKKTRSYSLLKYAKAVSVSQDSAKVRARHYMNQMGGEEYFQFQYARNIYYGYPGWELDVIKDYENKPDLSDTLLEGLGRAISTYAIGFFYDQYGSFSESGDPDRKLLVNSEPISRSRMAKFALYEADAIAVFKLLADRYPHYETRVGTSRIKYANENMFAYSSLLFAGYPNEAKSFLVPGMYPDSLLNLSRRYFSELEKNTILITGGDNDTYPLWYLQETENFRTDVLIINYSLLGLARYVKLLDDQSNHHLLKTPASSYLKRNFDYSLYLGNDSSGQRMMLSDFIDSLNVSDQRLSLTRRQFSTALPDTVRKYYCRYIIATKGKPLKDSTSNKSIELYIDLTLPDYVLMMNDFLLLDIYDSNQGRRNMYFTYFDDTHFFAPHLEKINLTYKFK